MKIERWVWGEGDIRNVWLVLEHRTGSDGRETGFASKDEARAYRNLVYELRRARRDANNTLITELEAKVEALRRTATVAYR